MTQCSIAIEILQKYETITSVAIISKYFDTNFTLDIIDKFYKRALVFPNLFPFEYIANNDYIRTKINKLAVLLQASFIIRNRTINKCSNCNET
jgi:hypothetical protein